MPKPTVTPKPPSQVIEKLELSADQWKMLETILREAREDGILTDDSFEVKVRSKQLTQSEAIFISILMDHRRFRDHVKNKDAN